MVVLKGFLNVSLKSSQMRPQISSSDPRNGRQREALQELLEVRQDYQEWQDSLPENLQATPTTAERLQGVCDIDIERALELVEEAEMIELPQGFGRD
jgi:hypothetical protein